MFPLFTFFPFGIVCCPISTKYSSIKLPTGGQGQHDKWLYHGGGGGGILVDGDGPQSDSNFCGQGYGGGGSGGGQSALPGVILIEVGLLK